MVSHLIDYLIINYKLLIYFRSGKSTLLSKIFQSPHKYFREPIPEKVYWLCKFPDDPALAELDKSYVKVVKIDPTVEDTNQRSLAEIAEGLLKHGGKRSISQALILDDLQVLT